MNRVDLARIASRRLNIRAKPEGEALIETAFRIMAETLNRGETVNIRGIGRFRVRLHPGGPAAYDPVRKRKTGQPVPPYRRLYFRPSRDFQLYFRGLREIPHRSMQQIMDMWVKTPSLQKPRKRRKRRTVEEMAG